MKITDFIYTPPSSATESIKLDKLAHMDEQSRFLDDYERNLSEGLHERSLGYNLGQERGLGQGDGQGLRSSQDTSPSLSPSPSASASPSLDHRPAKNRFVRWLHIIWDGPETPSDDPPQPISFLLPLERFPSTFARRYTKWFRVTLLITYCLLWLGLVLGILQPYFTTPPMSLAKNLPRVVLLSCLGAHDFWKGKNAACGMDGKACPSFQDLGQDVIFRCPAFCDRGSWLYSLVPIGDQRIRYRGYFVGGGPTDESQMDPHQVSSPYRGDSYLCGAGVHAGVISPFFGGCARISYASGAQARFPSANGRYGVGPSIGFDSFFPVSYFFKPLAANDNDHFSHCYDPRLFTLVLNIVLGMPIVYLASGAVTFWIITMAGYWTICLATDPPVTVDAMDRDTYSHLISLGLERMLPVCFILYVMWHSSIKRTFESNRASPITTLVLWYPLFWLGVLNNITFDRLPVDRLTWNDISHQSGALLAISSIIGVIAVCAVTQAYKIWLSGRFQKYLAIYIGMVLGLVAISLLPGLTLRIHHYILALLLIPGCSTRGHTAFMFQGILLGLFLSGAARWGLAAIAETASSLRRDDPEGRVLPPTFAGYNASLGLLRWTAYHNDTLNMNMNLNLNSSASASGGLHARKLPPSQYTHTSLLVNDIERYLGPATEINLKLLFSSGPLADLLALLKNATIYLRLGRKVPNSRSYSDYTNAAVLLWPAGDFVPPKPGVT